MTCRTPDQGVAPKHIAQGYPRHKLTPQQQADILKTAAQRSGPVMEFYKRDTLG